MLGLMMQGKLLCRCAASLPSQPLGQRRITQKVEEPVNQFRQAFRFNQPAVLPVSNNFRDPLAMAADCRLAAGHSFQVHTA
ncbi:MAG: hypothetical protein DMG73_04010 [Acidobacteria bacterium]|nr:MAG: hypothetical protein DMG73_04010 [Acidobacteriota bacterium]